MVDKLVANRIRALKSIWKAGSEQGDKIVHAMTLLGWTTICISPGWPLRNRPGCLLKTGIEYLSTSTFTTSIKNEKERRDIEETS